MHREDDAGQDGTLQHTGIVPAIGDAGVEVRGQVRRARVTYGVDLLFEPEREHPRRLWHGVCWQ